MLIRGEAGIGKSRLLGAAKEAAGDRLHEVFEAQCSPYHSNSALYPIIEMLTRRMGLEHDLLTADKLDLIEQFAAGRGVPLAEAVSLLAALFGIPAGDRYPPIELPPAKQRQRTLEVLAELLFHAVGGSPSLLLIEDLHWADPTMLDLVGELIATQASAPQLLVCTTRPELTAAWLEQLDTRVIDVEPLPQDETRALVASVIGNKKLPPELLQEVIDRTGGIPLFVEAVTRTVIEAGVLRELEDRYELTGPLPDGLIPETVRDSLMGRVDRLGEDKQVAQVAAAVGREFSFELLQDVLGMSEEGLARALEHLVDLELVSKSGDHSGGRLHLQARAHPGRGVRVAAAHDAAAGSRQDRRGAPRPLSRAGRVATRAARAALRGGRPYGRGDRKLDEGRAAGSTAIRPAGVRDPPTPCDRAPRAATARRSETAAVRDGSPARAVAGVDGDARLGLTGGRGRVHPIA